MKLNGCDGNRVELLINGEQYYPRVFEAMAQAREEILLETFIIYDDKVGQPLRHALIDAARRGVRVEVAVDGYGTADLPDDFISSMTEAGVRFHSFDPRPRLVGMRTNLFRRLHRKILVIDGQRAFIGGINYSADHLDDFGPQAKQDYAVEVVGPVVAQVHASSCRMLAPVLDAASRVQPGGIASGPTSAVLVERDNQRHRNDIEACYLQVFREARHRIVVANAYFFPGYRLLRELRNAARRGVEVTLILQGQPDMRWVRALSRLLYNYLSRDDVRIHEYCQRPLHGKVALVDNDWSTVGSSNLDPLSLSFNLEANLLIRDPAFNEHLYQHLTELSREHCKTVTLERMVRGYWWRAPLIFLGFHITRYFPRIAGWFPAHRQRLQSLQGPGRLPRGQDMMATSRWKTWGKRLLTVLFLVLIPVLLFTLARNLDWNEVRQSLLAYRPSTLALGLLLALCSYLVFASYDLLARAYTGHHLPARQVLPVAFVCYAFNLNFTTWVGGVALRYRLYSRLGLDTPTITRIITLGLLTNWMGYLLLAGTVFALGFVKLPESWAVGASGLRLIGVLMVAVALAYLCACAFATRRTWALRGHEVTLPSLRMALCQVALGASNWALMAALIHLLLPPELFYPSVLGVLLISCVAGVVAHIPAGLGVLEAVFLALLHGQLGQGTLVAALLGYRTLYYLIPLLMAVVTYLILEKRAKALRRQAGAALDKR